MLDGVLRKALDPAINRTARLLARRVSAEQMTFLGLAFGLASAAVIVFDRGAALALAFLALSRIADGLDGAIAGRRALPHAERFSTLSAILSSTDPFRSPSR